MRTLTFAALFTTVIILVTGAHLNALQSNAAPSSNGKKTVMRVTNEFTDAKTEIFKVMSSDDNGATWKIALQGVARKVGD